MLEKLKQSMLKEAGKLLLVAGIFTALALVAVIWAGFIQLGVDISEVAKTL